MPNTEQKNAANPPSWADWDCIWLDAELATMDPGSDQAYGAIRDGAIAVCGDRIAWVGRRQQIPTEAINSLTVKSAQGRWLTPGLIDCHTHLVYAGSRAAEFEQRLQGMSYAEVANAGGGIVSTVRMTRAATIDELVEQARPRLSALTREGVTTVEIKSGYGLDMDTEMNMLRAARALQEPDSVDVRTTFLGAHALPPEYVGRADDYIDFVCAEVMPAVAAAGLADAVDVFCESIGFSATQSERVLTTAVALGLPVKMHAEQLSDMGGAALAARFGALSADHLEYLSADGIAAMAAAGTVAVLLPGAFYFLRETQLPPINALRAAGVPIAISTDSNPGSSPVCSLLLMLSMACTYFRMTPEEALAGVTRHAAQALGLGDEVGTLTAGKRANFVVWDINHPAELAYRIGFNACSEVVKDGKSSPAYR